MEFTFKNTDNNVQTFKPVKVIHRQRCIPTYFKTKEVRDDMLNYEYNIKICSALIGNFESFIKWLFFKGFSMSDYAKQRKVPVNNSQKDINNSVSHLPGRATLIFMSDADAEQLTKLCDNANATNKWNDLYFIVMVGKNDYRNENAENLIRYYIQRYPDKHIVIFAKQIGARSFSIPQIDNVCIMINDPSYASAVQKMSRNQTSDNNIPNKIANTYWFSLNNLSMPLCPLFEVIKQTTDIVNKNNFKANFIDTADIFIEVDGEQMNMKDMPENPYAAYLKSTANTIYRMSENFEYMTTFEQREKIYKLIELLKADLSIVRGTNISTTQAERDADDIINKESSTFEGYTKEKTLENAKQKKEIIDTIMHIKNTLISVCIQYGKHRYLTFENFAADFSQITKNEFKKEQFIIIETIYNELKKINIIK